MNADNSSQNGSKSVVTELISTTGLISKTGLISTTGLNTTTEPVSKEELKKYLKLAVLDAESEDLDALTREVNSILETVRALFAVPVEGVEPMTHVMLSSGEGDLAGDLVGDLVGDRAGDLAQLNELVEGESELHIMRSSGVFRDDTPGQHMPTSKALENAPDRSGNFFRVPLVIED